MNIADKVKMEFEDAIRSATKDWQRDANEPANLISACGRPQYHCRRIAPQRSSQVAAVKHKKKLKQKIDGSQQQHADSQASGLFASPEPRSSMSIVRRPYAP